MPNDKRNRQDKAGEDTDRDVQNELNREEKASSEAGENPQRGESWSNYRTKELSGSVEEEDVQNVSNSAGENSQDSGESNSHGTSEAGGENFYRNRERGNYEEGQPSDNGGGGSLY